MNMKEYESESYVLRVAQTIQAIEQIKDAEVRRTLLQVVMKPFKKK